MSLFKPLQSDWWNRKMFFSCWTNLLWFLFGGLEFPVSEETLWHPGSPQNQMFSVGPIFLWNYGTVTYQMIISRPSSSLWVCCNTFLFKTRVVFIQGLGECSTITWLVRPHVTFSLFCTFTRETGDTRSVLFGSGEFVQLLQIMICCHCARTILVLVGVLG